MAGIEGEINTYNGGNNVWSRCEILTCGVYLGNMTISQVLEVLYVMRSIA